MTFEHKIIVGLEEIKAVIFRCNSCGASTAIGPDEFVSIPKQCPNEHAWTTESPTTSIDPVSARFLRSVRELRKPIYEKLGFRVLLEFDQPKP